MVCFVLFGCIWYRLVTLQNSVQNGLKWCKSSCHEVVSEFFATNTPDWPCWDLNLCFGAFHTIWVHLVPFGCLKKLGSKWAEVVKSLCHEVASELFATNATDPPHWTLKSCFGVFCTIWMHLGPFGCLTKLSAKRAELVQKFVSRSRVGIFRNERTWSTPKGSKLMFWRVSYYLGAFGTVWLPSKTWCKTG